MDVHLGEGDIIDGRYVVEGLLGMGGMAAVYKVRHAQLDTTHAMKVLSGGGRSRARRLMQEGRVQASLRHPNIVAVTDVVNVDGNPGLVMEYVPGPPLDRFLQNYRFDAEATLDAVVGGILDGVIAAHAHGLIHRDLKPANVMLAVTPDDLVSKVADFGLVKMLAEDTAGLGGTRSGITMGTPAYMAPEQIRDAKYVDARADVWSLGVILYEMITGLSPFEGADLIETFNLVALGERPPVRESWPDVPDRMVAAIEGALQVDTADRIADARTLRDTWMEGAMRSARSPWSEETLRLARSLGAGDDTADRLERSFRSRTGPTALPPRIGPATGPTGVPAMTMNLDDFGPELQETPAPPPVASATFATFSDTMDPGRADPTLDPTRAPDAVDEPARPTAVPATPAPAPGRRDRAPWLAAGAATVGVVALVAALSLVQLTGGPTPADPPPVEPEPTVPVAAPVPAPAIEPEPAPEPAPVAAPSPIPEPVAPRPVARPDPEPEPVVAPEPVAPEPVAEPEPEPAVAEVAPDDPPPEPTRITLTKDAPSLAVTVVDGDQRPVSTGEVVPGTYAVHAFFWPEDPERREIYGPFVLEMGTELQVRCMSQAYRCVAKVVP